MGNRGKCGAFVFLLALWFGVVSCDNSGTPSEQRPPNPAVTVERAREIAEADLVARGISATFHSQSGMSWERGQWVWELEFRPDQGGVIEYYINVHTGAIVKFEWDGGGSSSEPQPPNPAVTAERAREIAEADLVARGIPATFHSQSGMSLEQGQWVWELEFRPNQGGVIEYYINVHTGAIIKFEWSGVSSGQRPENPAVSVGRAREIAEADLVVRGISATFHSQSGMSWEQGQWVWELEFRPNQGVIEYYINVHTGAIVKFEWDR